MGTLSFLTGKIHPDTMCIAVLPKKEGNCQLKPKNDVKIKFTLTANRSAEKSSVRSQKKDLPFSRISENPLISKKKRMSFSSKDNELRDFQIRISTSYGL